jgi:hypothetical protein
MKLPSEDVSASYPDVPLVQVPVPPQAGSAAGNQNRPIEQIIHSIEPLIEDSVPRTQPTPLVKKRSPQIISEQVVSEPAAETSPAGVAASASPAVIWPVLPNTDSPLAPIQIPAPDQPPSSPPPVPSSPVSKLPGNLSIVLLVIVILAFIAGLVIVANLTPGQTTPGTNATTPVKTIPVIHATPKPTVLPTIVTTTTLPPGPTQVPIPSAGVYVRVIYPGTFTGVIGTPGNQFNVNDSGDQLYTISTTDGIVAVSVQKKDGSADKITAEIFKNGIMVKSSSTTTPKGTLEIQFDLKSLQSGNVSSPATV